VSRRSAALIRGKWNLSDGRHRCHRLDSFTAELVEKFHSIDNPPFVFDAYRKTNGYANVPIDGIWARAPYLHNGAIPNLWALLQTEAARPQSFYRGYDVTIRRMSDSFPTERKRSAPDSSGHQRSRQCNQGHLYGTSLKDAEKWDLIEYLKTQ